MKNKILLADDDKSVRKSLARVLESEGFDVLTAEDGRAAVREFIAEFPDLVLLDLNMPDKDGWAAFRLMDAAHTLIPVIVITARPNQHAQAVELGVDAFMEKPLNLPVLLEAIRRLFAETDAERMHRLTNPAFKTALLNHVTERSGNGAEA